MLRFLSRLLSFYDDDTSLPPAASDGPDDGSDWDEKTHNKRLNGILGGKKRDVIKQMDMKSKEKYDTMDGHIKQLNELRDTIRQRKANGAFRRKAHGST